MTVVALCIEPGPIEKSVAPVIAEELGMRLVDLRRFESVIAERSDFRGGRLCRYAVRWPSASTPLKIMCQDLNCRLREEIYETAAGGNVLLLGWSAVAVLRPFSHVACVLMRMPIEVRERYTMRRLGYSDVRTARLEIESADAIVARCVQSLFNADWRDPDLYDLVVTADHIDGAVCVDLLKRLTVSKRFQETPDSRARLVAELNALRDWELEHAHPMPSGDSVLVGSDRVSLAGIDTSEDAIARIERHLHGWTEARARPDPRRDSSGEA